jgi:hypothetical protein
MRQFSGFSYSFVSSQSFFFLLIKTVRKNAAVSCLLKKAEIEYLHEQQPTKLADTAGSYVGSTACAMF